MEKSGLKADILRYAYDTYGTQPEYLWEDDPDSAVLRQSGNRKWYGIFLKVPRKTLGLAGEGEVDIIDIKCSPVMIGSLLGQPGYLPAYHMNKNHWLTVLLDGTLPANEITPLLDLSYQLTAPKLRRARRKQEWEDTGK